MSVTDSTKPHVVDYIASQGWAEPRVEIFMGLRDGNLEALISNGVFTKQPSSLPNTVLRQMLQALDCLAHNGILHRDVKPDNILYTLSPSSGYIFQLTDFGLCNLATNAITYAGSPKFMAPEVLRMTGSRQTSKVDCWSLFVTMAYALDAGGYRNRRLRTIEECVEAALTAANTPSLKDIKELAVVEPEKRASSAQMLIKHYDGEGLSTPRKDVPALPSPGTPVLGNPAAIRKVKPRNKSKSHEISAGQNRVQKRPGLLITRKAIPQHSVRRQLTLDRFHVPGTFPAER